jgi:hypothetical protein
MTDSSDSKEYKWPPATLDSEKWRYDTCQDAMKSLTSPTTEFSDDGRLKKSFFNNRKSISKQFLENIQSFVDLDEEKEALLESFLLQAVRMWLVFNTQRYRLHMVLPGSEERDHLVKMKLAQENRLVFTIMPRLQRFGNSKGLELQEVSPISGCEGQAEPVRE